jgi:hypothetical protein
MGRPGCAAGMFLALFTPLTPQEVHQLHLGNVRFETSCHAQS